MAWISSKEFANRFSLNKKSLEKACFRANLKNKKICSLKSIIINFSYSSGIGGYSGKILQIWDTPLSEAQAQAIEKGYPFEYVLEMEKATTESTNIISEDYHTSTLNKSSNKTTAMTSVEVSAVDLKAKSEAQQSNALSHSDEVVKSHKDTDINKKSTHKKHSLISLTPNQKSQALSRELILQEYESAKLNGMKVSHFITLKNREDSALKLTQGKLFDWARKYKEQGLAGLADKRGVAKIGTSKLPTWAKQEVLNLYRQMGSGYCNRMQIWRSLHMKACEYMNFNYEKFLKCEIPPLFSLNSMNLFLDRYLKENSLEHALISYGSDKTDSYREPAYGVQRELYTSPNQLWQMDSSPLDAIVLDEDSKQMRPHFISIVDVYSGRSVGGIATTSDSNAVVRILWKAFNAMGKPKAIQFDNGKDYLSKKVQGLIAGLGIAYVRSAAYKGKAKAVVERRFRTIQGSYITALNGYIGRNTGERSIIEQQVAKRERRSKDMLGNPIKTQQKELLPLNLVSAYLDKAIEYWNIDRVSRRWGKNEGKSPMDLWYASEFVREEVSYLQFLLYADDSKLRTMEKEGVIIKPFIYVPTKYIPAQTKVHVRINIDSSNEAFIFDEQGEFICNAYDKKARPLSQEELKAISKEYKAETTASVLQIMGNHFKAISITIGQNFLPIVKSIASGISWFLDGFESIIKTFPTLSSVIFVGVGAFMALSVAIPAVLFAWNLMSLNILTAQKNFILAKNAILALRSAIWVKNTALIATTLTTKAYNLASLGLFKVLGLLATGFNALGGAIAFVGRAMFLNPIGLIITAIAALIGGVYLVYKHWGGIKEFFAGIFSYIGGLINSFVESFKSLFNFVGSAVSGIKSFFGFGDEKTAKQEALNSKSPELLPPANSRENISVSFNGGINVQTTDGKIPNNSQLSADVQREVEMAIKRAKENEKNRSLSDVV